MSSLLEHIERHSPTLPAQPSQGFVEDNPGEPSAQARVPMELAQSREGSTISVLEDVLGLTVVANDPARYPVQATIVALDDGTKGRALSAQSQRNQVLVRGRRNVVPFSRCGLHAGSP